MTVALPQKVEKAVAVNGSVFPGDDRIAYLILTVVCIFLYFVGLDNCPIIDPSEGYYVEACREMLQLGDYITPHLNYQIYFSKPIMNFWLIAGSYNLFGLSELSARLPFVILSSLLVLATYRFGKALMNRRAAFIAAFCLATSPLLMLVSRKSSIDIAFTFFVNIALFATALVLSRPTKWVWSLIYISLALGLLTKGPAALVLYGLGMMAFLVVARPSFKILKEWFFALKPFHGIVLFLAVALPWHIAVSQATDGLFLKVFFWYENLARFQGKTNLGHVKYWFFLGVLGYGYFPWILLAPRALASAFLPGKYDYGRADVQHFDSETKGSVGKLLALMNSVRRTILEDPRGRPLILLSVWSLTTFVFFSVSKTQLATYILPIIAPLSLVIGALIDRWITVGMSAFRKGDRTYVKSVSMILAIAGLVGAIGISVYAFHIDDPSGLSPAGLYMVATVLAVGFTKQMLELFNGRFVTACKWLACSLAIVFAIGSPLSFHLAVTKIQGGLKELALHLGQTPDKIAMFGAFMPSSMFYARKPVDTFFHGHQLVPVKVPPSDVTGHIYPNVPQSILVQDKELPRLKQTTPCPLVEVERRGDWAWYRTPGYELESNRTLEDTFRDPAAFKIIVSGEAQTGPLTVPFATGKLYRQYSHRSE